MSKSQRTLLDRVKSSGKEDSKTQEQQIFLIKLFSLIGTSITGVLGIIALLNSNFSLAGSLLLASVIFVLGATVQKITGKIGFSANLILTVLYMLMFYLIHSGGANNTGPLWIFMTAPVTLFLSGFKEGLFKLFLFLVVICTMLFYPDEILLATSYPFDFKLRLIYSFLTVVLLASLYEYARAKTYQDVKKISKEFEKLAKIDPLTQLSNRHDATLTIDNEQRRLRRNNSNLGIILADIDHFKLVNDKFGHIVGDKVLSDIAQIFKKYTREQDTVARWGGEEFLFILPDTNLEQSIVLAQKIHKKMSEYSLKVKNENVQVTLSLGINTIQSGQEIEQAISKADEYLYQAKKLGRHKSVCPSGVVLPPN